MTRAQIVALEVERKAIIAAGVPELSRNRLDWIRRKLEMEERRANRARWGEAA